MIKFKRSVSLLVVLLMVLVLGSQVMAAQKGNAAGFGKLVNINTADVAQLTRLPRVGEKIGQRIIDYRKKNGKFKKPADIMKVKGTGEKTFENMKDMITVG